MTRSLYGVALSLLLAPALALAQAPAPAPKPAPAAPPAQELPAPPSNYQYGTDGRRDPFLSLINRGTEARGQAPIRRGEGVAGLITAELVVRGILQSRGTWMALVSGPDGKILTVRAGDRLADGLVRTITPQAVVIVQEVNDPLSLEKQREVRKFLRGGEEVK